jgi:hypothetical protein
VTATSLSRFGRALLLALWLAAVPARAEMVLVLPASGAGVSSAIISSARALFVTTLAQREPRLRVLDMDRPPTPEMAAAPVAIALGQERRADAIIMVDLRRVPPTTTLSVTVLSVPAGEKLFTGSESTTAGPEVVPAMVQVAVGKLLATSRVAAGRDGQSAPRTIFLGARAGARAPFETAGDTAFALGGAGIFVVTQLPRLSAEIGFDHVENGRATSTRFGLGLALPFDVEADGGFYLGAGLYWQHSHFGGQGAGGFVVTPSFGWNWHRHESLGLRLEGGAFYNLYSERAVDRLIPGAAEPHRSYGVELWVGTWL